MSSVPCQAPATCASVMDVKPTDLYREFHLPTLLNGQCLLLGKKDSQQLSNPLRQSIQKDQPKNQSSKKTNFTIPSCEDGVVSLDRCSKPDKSDFSFDDHSYDDEISIGNDESSKNLENLSASELAERMVKSKNVDALISKVCSEDEMASGEISLLKRLWKPSQSVLSDLSSEENDCEVSDTSEDEGNGELEDDQEGCFEYDDEEEDDFIFFEKDTSDKQEKDFEGEEEESDNDTPDNVQVLSTRYGGNPEKIKPDKPILKVRFAEIDEICILYDDEDYRLARIDENVLDRLRFRDRIKNVAAVLDPVLITHQQKIQEKLIFKAEDSSPKRVVNIAEI